MHECSMEVHNREKKSLMNSQYRIVGELCASDNGILSARLFDKDELAELENRERTNSLKCKLCQLGYAMETKDQHCRYSLNGCILEIYPAGARHHQFRIAVEYCPICGRGVGKLPGYQYEFPRT